MRRWPGESDTGVTFLILNSVTHLALNSMLFLSMAPALGLTSNEVFPAMLKMGLFFLLLTADKGSFFHRRFHHPGRGLFLSGQCRQSTGSGME